MFAIKLVLATVLVVASARHVPWEDQFSLELEDNGPYEEDPFEQQEYQIHHPGLAGRVRRQVKPQGSLSLNSDGGIGLGGKIPLVSNDKNALSAIGSVDLNSQMKTAASGIGLALDNAGGHSLSVMKQNLPGFGERLTGAGKLNVFNNDLHKVDVNGFVSRNMPTAFPGAPNFNTVGGGVDYMYNQKVGGSLGMASTPFLGRNDYSAMGNLNLYRNPTTSVDFSGGFKRFDTPVMNSGWKPNFLVSLTKSF